MIVNKLKIYWLNNKFHLIHLFLATAVTFIISFYTAQIHTHAVHIFHKIHECEIFYNNFKFIGISYFFSLH